MMSSFPASLDRVSASNNELFARLRNRHSRLSTTPFMNSLRMVSCDKSLSYFEAWIYDNIT